MLAGTVDGCAGAFARVSLVSRRGCTCTAGCIPRAAFAACAATTMSAAATSAAAAPLATFAALGPITRNLTLLSARLGAGARLASG